VTNEQALEVVTLIRAATGGRHDQQTIDYFLAALLPLNFRIALSTATTGVVVWRYFPSWAEFREIYKTQERLAEPIGEQRAALPPREKYGTSAPEWVWVWSWARSYRSPRNLIAFPQQNLPDTETSLSIEEYEELREEWVAAGSPKAKNPIPLAR
jgi:hypothetical protein